VNCAVYWRSKQIRQCFANGFFWDNGVNGDVDVDPVVGNAYELPKHKFHAAGRRQYAYSYMMPRQFFKRLARINAQAGLECTSNDNGGMPVFFNGAYFRDNVMWENNYVSTERPHMKGYSKAESRYFTETYSGRTGYYCVNVGWILAAGGDPFQDRSMLADALLYDVGVLPDPGHTLANVYPRRNVREALEKFGYLTEDAVTVEYIPYWRSDSYYQYGFGVPASSDEFADNDAKGLAEQLKGVICTIYKNKKTGKALLVLANGTDQPISQNLIIKPLLLDGRPPKKCTDVEVDEEIGFAQNPKDKKLLTDTFNPLFIAPWQFRMVVVE
jgi:hypothetical protein